MPHHHTQATSLHAAPKVAQAERATRAGTAERSTRSTQADRAARAAQASRRARSASVLAGVAALGLIAAPASSAAKSKTATPEFLTASVDFTSIITTRCPAIVGIDAFTTDVTTTIYRHTVTGTGPAGKARGTMEVKGESIYTIERTIEGESDTMKPYKIGPTKRPFSTRSASWKGVVHKITAGRKKGRQLYVSYLDFTGIDPTLDVQISTPVPRVGQQRTLPISGESKTKALDGQGGGCTSSETKTVSGSVTYGRAKKAARR